MRMRAMMLGGLMVLATRAAVSAGAEATETGLVSKSVFSSKLSSIPNGGRLVLQFYQGAASSKQGTSRLMVSQQLEKGSDGKPVAVFEVQGAGGNVSFHTDASPSSGVSGKLWRGWIRIGVRVPASAADASAWMQQFATCAALFTSPQFPDRDKVSAPTWWSIVVDVAKGASAMQKAVNDKPVSEELEFPLEHDNVRSFKCQSSAIL